MNERRFKRPESVLIVIYNEAGDVLLLRRRDHPDFWQSVTGSLLWDEFPSDAARRELKEETGLDARGALMNEHRVFAFEILEAWRYRYQSGVTRNREHVFSLAVKGYPAVRLNPREHSAFAWRRRGEAMETVWSWTNRRAILDIVPDRPVSH